MSGTHCRYAELRAINSGCADWVGEPDGSHIVRAEVGGPRNEPPLRHPHWLKSSFSLSVPTPYSTRCILNNTAMVNMSRVIRGAMTGVQVLVTRPQPQADALTSLRRMGASMVFGIRYRAARTHGRGMGPSLPNSTGQAVICISAARRTGRSVYAVDKPQWPLHQNGTAVGPASGKTTAGLGPVITCGRGGQHQ